MAFDQQILLEAVQNTNFETVVTLVQDSSLEDKMKLVPSLYLALERVDDINSDTIEIANYLITKCYTLEWTKDFINKLLRPVLQKGHIGCIELTMKLIMKKDHHFSVDFLNQELIEFANRSNINLKEICEKYRKNSENASKILMALQVQIAEKNESMVLNTGMAIGAISGLSYTASVGSLMPYLSTVFGITSSIDAALGTGNLIALAALETSVPLSLSLPVAIPVVGGLALGGGLALTGYKLYNGYRFFSGQSLNQEEQQPLSNVEAVVDEEPALNNNRINLT